VRTKFISKLDIPYENGGPVTLCVNGVVITSIDEIKPFPEVEAIKTIVVRTDEGRLGGGTPLVVESIEGV
jgi:hypothetical protein